MLKVPKINWIPFDKNNPPANLCSDEEYLILLREDNYDKLLERIHELGLNEQDYWWYLNLRKFGSVKHSGFGMGFDRFIMYITGASNIRDVLPFPRTPKNCNF